MNNEYKESVVEIIDKRMAILATNDKSLFEFYMDQLGKALVEKLLHIMAVEVEIIVTQSGLKITELPATASVEYKNELKWAHLVRCKECKWYQEGYDIDGKWFTRCNGNIRTYGHTNPDWFCGYGERSE